MNKPVTNGRVTRWLLLLQEYDITICDRPERENVVADFLSRLNIEGSNDPVEDVFPNEHLFALFVHSPWFADISNYLATGKLPQHFSPREKQKVIRQSAMYSWIQGQLFRTGPDYIIRHCVREDEIFNILKYCHDDPCGGHFWIKGLLTKS
jgi:hypothetical protein